MIKYCNPLDDVKTFCHNRKKLYFCKLKIEAD